MALSLNLKKRLSSLVTFAVLFSLLGSGGLAIKAPTSYAAGFTVSNLADSGAGSLRQAILDANANPGPDAVDFTVAGTITLLSALPSITEDLILDARSTVQGGYNIVIDATGQNIGLEFSSGSENSMRGMAVTGAQTCIRISNGLTGLTLGSVGSEGEVGANGCSDHGLEITGASGVSVINAFFGTSIGNQKGIVISNNASNIVIGGTSAEERVYVNNSTQNGIHIEDASSVTIQGTYIGAGEDGASNEGNGQNGILVEGSSNDILIGGNSSGRRNLISGNGFHGITIYTDGVRIQGNYIGTNANGDAAIPNVQGGISLESANNTVGGANASDGHVISGNTGFGIKIDDTARNADGNVIKNNLIGLGANGETALGNGSIGIQIHAANLIDNTTIGGSGQGNVISSNTASGISAQDASNLSIFGNIIGLSQDGNSIRRNLTGIHLKNGSDHAVIGDASDDTRRNTITGNTFFSIHLDGANNASIVNNCIGATITCTQNDEIQNGDEEAIYLENGASNNTIGGESEGAMNFIYREEFVATIRVGNTAGNSNDFSINHYADLSPGNRFSLVTAPGNEGIADPVLSSVIRKSPTSVELTGETTANTRVDIYAGGEWMGSITSDEAGDFFTTLSSTANNYTVIARSDGGSSSGSAVIVAATDDATAPSAPTAEASADSVDIGEFISISGTGEPLTSVYLNTIDTGVDVDEDGNYILEDIAVLLGLNTYNITLVDGMNNISEASSVNVRGETPQNGGIPFPPDPEDSNESSGSDGNNGNNPEENGTDENNTNGNSIGGDVETGNGVETGNVVDPGTQENINTSSNENGTEENGTEENNTNESTETVGTNSGGKNQGNQTTGNLIDKIKEIVEPIRAQNIRDSLPEEPSFGSNLLEDLAQLEGFENSSNTYGIPDKLIEIKFGDLKGQYEITSQDFLDRDLDGDGLTNGEELIWMTDLNTADTDEDGVDDTHEIFEKGTDPNNYDSDHDGVSDTKDENPMLYSNPEQNVEAKELTDYIAKNKIDMPLGTIDSDKDGLVDSLELYIGSDPMQADTDEDGVSDGDEFNHYGTDPNQNNTSKQFGKLRLINTFDGEIVSEGEQIYMGQGEAFSQVGVYSITPEGGLVLLGETETDEDGRFSFVTKEKLSVGEQRLVAISGDPKNPKDLTLPISVEVVKYVKEPTYIDLDLKNGISVMNQSPELTLVAADNYRIVVSWKSTVFSQTLISDSTNQVINIQPGKELELGEHTVTWYAVDLENNQKSAPTEVPFTITNPAFISGEQVETNSLTILLGSIAVLASLTAIGLYFRKGGKASKRK